MTTGRSGLGLCPTRDQPDFLGLKISRPATDQLESRVRLDGSSPENDLVSVGSNLAETHWSWPKIGQIWPKSDEFDRKIAFYSKNSPDLGRS